MKRVLQWLFGSSCLLCKGAADDALCSGCLNDLPYLTSACHRCALPLADTEIHICGGCMKSPPNFDSAQALLRYAPPVPTLLQAWKYQQRLGLERVLVLRMLSKIDEMNTRPDVIVPVPLYRRRLRQRGYNQALLLARGLSVALQVPIQQVRRVKATPKQTGLSAKQRRQNLRDAFAAAQDFAGMHVVVVDDVLTTGATAAALTAVLRERGAKRVDVWVAARAVLAFDKR